MSVRRLQQEGSRPAERTLPLREVQPRVPQLQIQTPALRECTQCASFMRVCHTCSATDFEESCNSRDHTCTLKSTRMNNLSPFHLLPASDSQANLADFGDNQWVTCFQETAEVLLGHSAETLGQLRDTVRHAHKRYRTLCPVNSFTWLCIYVCVCVFVRSLGRNCIRWNLSENQLHNPHLQKPSQAGDVQRKSHKRILIHAKQFSLAGMKEHNDAQRCPSLSCKL